MLWKSDNDKFAFQIQPKRMDIARPESVSQPQHFYPATRLPVDLYRFTDANGMILVFNIDSRSSFDALEQFINARRQDIGSKTVEPKVLCLVGNKLDKSRDKRKILCLEGEALALKLECQYVECSAKDQKGLDKLKSAMIKAMETQRSQLQYTQQQRERVEKGSRILQHKNSFMRRLHGSRSDTPRIAPSNEPSSSQQMTSNQRHRSFASSGRYKGGLVASSLSLEDRIEEEDEETESDGRSRSSSQQSSNTSTTSKQSSITITPPSNTLGARPSHTHRLTTEKLPLAAAVSLSPVCEQPSELVQSLSDLALSTPPVLHEKTFDGIKTTTPAHVSDSGNLLQSQSPPKEEGQPDFVPTVSQESSPVIPRGPSPQFVFNTQSTSQPRDPSPEVVDKVQTTNSQNPIEPAKPSQLPQLETSQPTSSTTQEKRKLDEERAKLEEEKEKLRQEMQELQEHQARLEDRRRGDIERRQIEAERRKIVEARKLIEEERQNLKEARRLIEEEEEQWNYQQNRSSDEAQADHSPTLDEKFGGIFPGLESQEDAKHEESRRYHQEQFQQEQQQDLQLRSSTSSPTSVYSVQRDYFPLQKAAISSEDKHHSLRSNAPAASTSPQKNPKELQRRSSLRTTRSAPRSEPVTEKTKAQHSPPLSPDITQTLRRFLGKKESKKPNTNPNDQRETMKVLRDELGIAMPEIPATDPPPRSPKSLLLPPGTKIQSKESVTRTEKVDAEEKPKSIFPSKYI